MIVKLALLDTNRGYTRRLLDVCREKYADKLEIACFSSRELLKESMERESYDVLLVEEALDWGAEDTPAGTAFAWLTGENYSELDGTCAICRYQRVSQLYREILALYVENHQQKIGAVRPIGEGARMVAVTSAAGGCGASTVAAALARHLTHRKRRVTYINLEAVGDTGLYFKGEGKESFSELIYALKSNRANLPLRMESILRTDPSGVRFFAAPGNPLEMNELTEEEMERLLDELGQGEETDAVVFDVPFSMTGVARKVLDRAETILMVSNGSDSAEGKLKRLCRGLEIMGEEEILGRMRLVENHGMRPAEDCPIPALGVLPKHVGGDRERMIRAMAEEAALGQIL